MEEQLKNLCFGVHFVQHKINKYIPYKWCKSINLANALNESLNHNVNYFIFFSKDFSKEPNFLLPIADKFDENVDGCHVVKILKAYGTY